MERLGDAIESFITSPVRVTQEMVRIFPDGLVIGMGFFSVLTLSYSYGIFFMSLLESILLFYGFRGINSYLNITSALPTKSAMTTECVSGFMSRTIESLTLFGSATESAFPSASIFMISMASAYILAVLNKFSKELEVLGETYSSRFYIATIALPLLIMAFSLFRIYFGCDSIGVILFSIVIGVLAGGLIVEQNYRLLGPDSINIVGIPLLRSRTADGKKLYVCPTQSKE